MLFENSSNKIVATLIKSWAVCFVDWHYYILFWFFFCCFLFVFWGACLERSFLCAAPSLWNKLSIDIRMLEFDQFKSRVKTELYLLSHIIDFVLG